MSDDESWKKFCCTEVHERSKKNKKLTKKFWISSYHTVLFELELGALLRPHLKIVQKKKKTGWVELMTWQNFLWLIEFTSLWSGRQPQVVQGIRVESAQLVLFIIWNTPVKKKDKKANQLWLRRAGLKNCKLKLEYSLMMLLISVRIIPVKFIVNNIFTGMCWFGPLQCHRGLTNFRCPEIAWLWRNARLSFHLDWCTQWSATLGRNRLYLDGVYLQRGCKWNEKLFDKGSEALDILKRKLT